MESMRSKSLNYVCALLCLGGLSACDTNPTDAASDTSKSADMTGEDAPSADEKEAAKPASEPEDQAKAQRPSATSPNGAEVSVNPPLEISSFLNKKDLSTLTPAEIAVGKLTGKPATPTYNSIHLYPDDGAGYGVGLQVWSFKKDSTSVEFVTRMRAQYLGVKDAPGDAPTGGERAFISARGGIENYIFAPNMPGESPHYVLAISCGEDLCKKGWADVKLLANTVEKRVMGKTNKAAKK